MSNDWWFVIALVAGTSLTLAIFALYLSIKRLDERNKIWELGYREGWKKAFIFGQEIIKTSVCPKCGETMVKDNSIVYPSLPPKYKYICPGCGREEVKSD